MKQKKNWQGFHFTESGYLVNDEWRIALKPEHFFKRYIEMQLLREYRLKATHPQQWDLVFND